MSRMKEVWQEQQQHNGEVEFLESEIEARDFAIVQQAITIARLEAYRNEMSQTIRELTIENINFRRQLGVDELSIGDTIDGTYKLVAREGRHLALVYLPLNIRQLLPVNRPS